MSGWFRMAFLLVTVLMAAPALGDAAPAKGRRYDSRVIGDAQRKRESAEAVSVYSTAEAKQQSLDLGQVLNRVPGVAVSRIGGLGSETRFSLNGLSGEQIRL